MVPKRLEVIVMEKYKVGIIGGTGMVGQRFITLMENHPWFQLTCIAASPRSAARHPPWLAQTSARATG